MEQDTEETAVVFRRWKPHSPYLTRGDVIALFPLIENTFGTCVSYEHVGQHGGADYAGCIAQTTHASLEEPEVQALKAELESIGYRLRVLKRAPNRYRTALTQ